MHFQPLHNEVKSVLGNKESYSMGKKGLKFSQIVLVRLEGGDPPQSGQPDRFFTVFFTPPLTLALQKNHST